MDGGLTHTRMHHLVKWLWEQVWDFSALGNPTSSIFRRVVKLIVPHYYSMPLPLQKRDVFLISEGSEMLIVGICYTY